MRDHDDAARPDGQGERRVEDDVLRRDPVFGDHGAAGF
jgi:hypothetical protein